MQTINIVGAPGHGKTTLTEALNSLHINDVLFNDGKEAGNPMVLVVDGTVDLTNDFTGSIGNGQELLGVFITKADLAEDIEMMELLELELRESLQSHGVDSDTPIMTGSALMALQGDNTSINKLRVFLRSCGIS